MLNSVIAPSLLRVGHEPIQDVHVMEDHDGAYDVWKAEGVRDRILVHFDGHIDFDWLAERSFEELLAVRNSEELERLLREIPEWSLKKNPIREGIHIGNFIYPAIREGFIRQFFWVVPDPFWATREERSSVKECLRQMASRRPMDCGPMKVTDFGIHLTVLGLPLTVCTLENLPRFAEPLLLDIDVDYLLTQSIRRPAPYFESQTISPWLWPTQFIERLKSLELPIDLVTIAYSVNGGYTPLGYKYFGDILKEWLVHPEESITNHPKSGSAAESYLKLTLALEREDMSTAQDLWRAMRDADPSYRTLWATAAYREETHGRWRSALDGYERMTRMDPEWEVPSLGKGRMLSRLRQWTLAEEAFQEAYRLNPSSSAATYGLGACAFRRGSYEVAHRLWKTSVLQNPKMAISWYALADLETQRGNYRSALEYAQKYLSLGWSNPRVHWLMAWGAWRLGRRRMAQREFILWVQQLFRVIKMRAISLLRKIFRARRANAGGVSEVCSPTDPQLV